MTEQEIETKAESLLAEGWQRHGALSGFSGLFSPLWYRVEEERLSVAFLVADSHCNEHLGTLHGGAAMTFADTAGGFAVSRALGHMRCATLQLQTHFTAVARTGDLVWCTPEIVRQTRDIVFLRGLLETAERPVASFDGIWKILAER